MNTSPPTINILLVEDNPGDVDLTLEAFAESRVTCHIDVVEDGAEALAYLNNEPPFTDVVRPHLILLDLNLPDIDGFEVLQHVKQTAALKVIPVIVLTTSQARQDILQSYNLHANAYLTKPIEIDQFLNTVAAIDQFWLQRVHLLNN